MDKNYIYILYLGVADLFQLLKWIFSPLTFGIDKE